MPPTKQRNLANGSKRKRKRTIVTTEQLAKLEKLFKNEIWPSRSQKLKLCKDINMSEHFVRVWYQNRRVRLRREEAIALKIKEEDQNLEEHSECKNKINLKQEAIPITKAISIKEEPDYIDTNNTEASHNARQRQSNRGTTNQKRKLAKSRSALVQVADVTKNNHAKSKCIPNNPKPQLSTNNLVETTTTSTAPVSTTITGTSKLLNARLHTRESKFHPHKIGNIEKAGQPTSAGYRQILPLDSANISNKGSGEPYGTGTPIQNLLKLTKTINNQMNWGTFGMTSTKRQSPVSVNIPEKKPTIGISISTSREQEKVRPMTSTSTQNIREMLSICAAQPTRMNRSNMASDNSTSSRGTTQARMSYPDTKTYSETMFRAIINMIAVNEGGIMAVDHPEFSHAANDALYGIRINRCARLVYTKDDGLNLVDDIDMSM